MLSERRLPIHLENTDDIIAVVDDIEQKNKQIEKEKV